MLIKRKTLVVDCAFIFKNDGPATSVRMGFPDYDSDAESEGEPVKTTFKSFRSSVDGKRYRTRFMRGVGGEGWQVKTVRFQKGQTRRVRNVYEVALGILGLGEGYIHSANYILATGASWKGTIGKTEVVVVFGRGSHPPPRQLLKDRESDKRLREPAFWKARPNFVAWRGPAQPRLSANMLFFTRKNWEPTDADDVNLTFHWQRNYDW